MRWIIVGTAVAALALAGVGCGGSSDSGSDAAADTVVTDTVVTDTSGPTEQTSTGGDDLDELSGECKGLDEAGDAFEAAIYAGSAGGGNDDLDAAADAYKAFVEKAPDEIRGDVEVLADLMVEMATAFRIINLQAGEAPTPEQAAKLKESMQSLDTADARKAVAAVEAWAQENCGATP